MLGRNPIRPETILDIGTGNGSRIAMLAERLPARYTVTDVAAPAIEHVRANPFPGLVGAEVAPAESLPFPDGSFDLAVLSHTLEHLPHPRGALLEALRVAEWVLVEIPLQNALLSNVAAKVRELRSGQPRTLNWVGHLHFFSDRTFRAAMTGGIAFDERSLVFVDSERYIMPVPSRAKMLGGRLLRPRLYGLLLQTCMVYLVRAA